MNRPPKSEGHLRAAQSIERARGRVENCRKSGSRCYLFETKAKYDIQTRCSQEGNKSQQEQSNCKEIKPSGGQRATSEMSRSKSFPPAQRIARLETSLSARRGARGALWQSVDCLLQFLPLVSIIITICQTTVSPLPKVAAEEAPQQQKSLPTVIVRGFLVSYPQLILPFSQSFFQLFHRFSCA